MGLKALFESNEIISIAVDKNKWQEYKKNKKFKNTLKMPCCNTKAVMKNSHLGLQYFAHHRKDNCSSLSKSLEHLMSKKIAYDIAMQERWNTFIEHSLEVNENKKIIADILIEKNGYKIALEFQISNHSVSKMIERTRMYEKLNIMVIWFNSFNNQTYDYSNNEFDLTFQKYQIIIKKKDSLINLFCEETSFQSFLSMKLYATNIAKISKTNILDCFSKNSDNFIRIDRNKKFDDSTSIIFHYNWEGYSNGFYIQENVKFHFMEGIYIQGFKSTKFKFKLDFKEIVNI